MGLQKENSKYREVEFPGYKALPERAKVILRKIMDGEG